MGDSLSNQSFNTSKGTMNSAGRDGTENSYRKEVATELGSEGYVGVFQEGRGAVVAKAMTWTPF